MIEHQILNRFWWGCILWPLKLWTWIGRFFSKTYFQSNEMVHTLRCKAPNQKSGTNPQDGVSTPYFRKKLSLSLKFDCNFGSSFKIHYSGFLRKKKIAIIRFSIWTLPVTLDNKLTTRCFERCFEETQTTKKTRAYQNKSKTQPQFHTAINYMQWSLGLDSAIFSI